MNYLILKSLHIISVVTWFAGLFYMPRLFIYFAEANEKNEPEKSILQKQFKIMQFRLWYGITTPSAIAVLILGGSLLKNFLPISDHPWLVLKLIFVVGLYIYHFFLHSIFKQQQNNIIKYSPSSLRIINEISTVFLFAIVFLVTMKNVLNTIYGIFGMLALILILLTGIKIYKNIRKKSIE
jgi:putative membrane protein